MPLSTDRTGAPGGPATSSPRWPGPYLDAGATNGRTTGWGASNGQPQMLVELDGPEALLGPEGLGGPEALGMLAVFVADVLDARWGSGD
ncbi:MAG TPA: hypothetical protein VGN19_01245, partial [Pedococcus sp.]|nr:hypothetical protein [Pedococcus sp.]